MSPNKYPGFRMAFGAGNRSWMHAGGKPTLKRFLIFMAGKAEKGVRSGKTN